MSPSAQAVAIVAGVILLAGAIPRLVAETSVAPHDRDIAKLSAGETVPLARLMVAADAHHRALAVMPDARLRMRYGRILCAAAANAAPRRAAALEAQCTAALRLSLNRSPAQPYAAFALATTGTARGLPETTLDRALRLSIAAGPALEGLVAPRLALGLRLWPSLSKAGRAALGEQITWAAANRPGAVSGAAQTPLRRALIRRYAPDFSVE